jgi:hypothetical protein
MCFFERNTARTLALLNFGEYLSDNALFHLFGLAFTKMTARRLGVYPVWYVDITPGHDWLMNPINEAIGRELKRL